MELGTVALAATLAATTLAPSTSINQRYPNIEMRLMNWENTLENPVSCYRFEMDYKSVCDSTKIQKEPEVSIEPGTSCIDKIIGFLPYEGLNLVDDKKQSSELRLTVQKHLSLNGWQIRKIVVLLEYYADYMQNVRLIDRIAVERTMLREIPFSWNQVTPPKSIVIAIDAIIKGASLKESTISLRILAQQPTTLFAAALNKVVENIEKGISSVSQVESVMPLKLHSLLMQRIGRQHDDD